MTYKTVENSEGKKRSFAITVGLQEGYGEGLKIHSVAEVINLAMNWMKKKAAAGLKFITGAIFEGSVVYAWGTNAEDVGGGSEPTVEFRGEISNLYGSDLSDADVKELLNDLGKYPEIRTTILQMAAMG